MLIQLDGSIGDASVAFTSRELDSLRNLAIAASEGSHYLVAPRALASHLSRHPDLGKKEKAIYRMIDDRYSDLAGLAQSIPLKIRVFRNARRSRTHSENQTEIGLPLDFFSLSASVQPTILLCENSDDCDLIVEMARLFVRNKKVGNVKVVFENKSGGGSGCASEAAALLNKPKRLFLTIVDSDRICPGGSLGSTASGVKVVYDRLNPVESQLIILSAKELENLLPDNFYRDCVECLSDHRKSVKFMSSLFDAGCHLARHYVDVKEGLALEEILNLSNRPADFASVWWPVVEGIRDKRIPADSSSISCASNEVCAKRGACECVLMGANRMSLLSKGTELSKQDLRDFWQNLPQTLKESVEEVGRTAFAWGCGGSFHANI